MPLLGSIWGKGASCLRLRSKTRFNMMQRPGGGQHNRVTTCDEHNVTLGCLWLVTTSPYFCVFVVCVTVHHTHELVTKRPNTLNPTQLA